jgi:hypothetical protein
MLDAARIFDAFEMFAIAAAVAAQDDHCAAVVIARSPHPVLVMLPDGLQQAVARTVKIDRVGQLAPPIININGREHISLDDQWQVIVDPYDAGAVDYHAQPLRGNSAFYKNYKPQSKSELVEYDFDNSGQLRVPGDWNTQRESLLFYEGSVWYKRMTCPPFLVQG